MGLRWWNQVDEDGKSHWVFESRKVSKISLGKDEIGSSLSTAFPAVLRVDASCSHLKNSLSNDKFGVIAPT